MTEQQREAFNKLVEAVAQFQDIESHTAGMPYEAQVGSGAIDEHERRHGEVVRLAAALAHAEGEAVETASLAESYKDELDSAHQHLDQIGAPRRSADGELSVPGRMDAAPQVAPVPWPKREGITEDMRAGFERLYREKAEREGRTLERNEQGAYAHLTVDSDWIFYQRAWADALEATASQVAVPEGWRLELSKYGVIVTSPDGKMTEVQSPADPPIFHDDPVIYQFLKTILAAAPSAPAGESECKPEITMRDVVAWADSMRETINTGQKDGISDAEACLATEIDRLYSQIRADAWPDPDDDASDRIGAAGFKAFHASLCRRFGYTHDNQYWYRDLVSLEEHIAAQAQQPVRGPDELRQAAAEAVKAIRSIPEKKLLALDNDPHPPSTLSVSAEHLELALSAPAPDEREIAAKALDSMAVELDTHLWRDAAIRVRGRAESIRGGTDAPSAIRRAISLRAGKEGE